MTSKPAPPGRRPHRRMFQPGTEMVTYSVEPGGRVARQTWRQIGWQGQTGAFYALGGDANPSDHEPGSFAPIWTIAHTDHGTAEDLIAELEAA